MLSRLPELFPAGGSSGQQAEKGGIPGIDAAPGQDLVDPAKGMRVAGLELEQEGRTDGQGHRHEQPPRMILKADRLDPGDARKPRAEEGRLFQKPLRMACVE